MTKVTVYKKANNIYKLTASGHTGYSEEGSDIVCASLSSIIQTALMGLVKVLKVDVKYEIEDTNGYLYFELPQELTEQEKHDCGVILDTMLCGITDLVEGYSKFIKLEVK